MNMKKSLVLFLGLAMMVLLIQPQGITHADMPQSYSVETMELISQKSDGTLGNNASSYPSVSANGQFVAFESWADNLVADDTNVLPDIFVKDRSTGTIERVSISSSGVEANGASSQPSISGDGRYVAFTSEATNLVADDTNGFTDVFVYDRELDTIERISVTSAGAQDWNHSNQPAISADGNRVVFTSRAILAAGDPDYMSDIYLRDRTAGTTTLLSTASDGTKGDSYSENPAISADGTHVAFASLADNLVADDTNEANDIFVKNIQSGVTERVSVSSAGSEGNNGSNKPSLSSDGVIVAFHSTADNLVANDTNSESDIFVYDRNTDTIERVSISSSGTQANGYSETARLDGSGRFVTFSSLADNLVSADTNLDYDVFVYDREDDTITIISVDSSGDVGNSASGQSAISQDGAVVVFYSDSDNLVSGDTNSIPDVFAAEAQLNLATPRLRSPGVDATVWGGRPTLRWFPVDDATVYDVELYGLSGELLGSWNKGVGACDPGPFCDHRIPFDLQSAYGTYSWRVRARNTTLQITSEWSTIRYFTYTQLARTALISPASGTSLNYGYPELNWTDITGATKYLVQFRLPDDTFLFNVLVDDAGNCAEGGNCAWTLDRELLPGEYKWHVRAKNGRNFGRWTAYWNLTITE
jgi:hypothetical protein